MILDVIKFELKYRLNRPATYLYFILFFMLAFGAVAWDGINLSGAIGKVKQNSSFVLHNMAGIMGLVPGLFIVSAIMGVAILRDTEHKMDAILFTTTISKSTYFHGRFIGSFLILLGTSSGFVFGIGTGLLMPWLDQTKLLPWQLSKIMRPWLAFIVTNMFLLACIFFSVGALARRMIFVYLQAVIFIALYVVAQTLIGNVENIQLAVLLDPIGFYGFQVDTRYWTIAEKSNLDVPFSGYLRQNRFVWIGIALAIYLVSYVAFKFRTVPQGLFSKKAKLPNNSPVKAETLALPISKGSFASGLFWFQFWVLTKLYYKETIRSVPFIGFALIAFIILLINAESANQRYGQELYPVSSLMADFATSYATVIFMAVGLFYSGEMIWKEKDIRFDQIFDALPTLNAVPLVSKWLALTLSIGTVLLLTIPMGILLQLAKGFTHIELGVYLQIIFFQSFVPLAISLALGLVVQSLVDNKFTGYALHILVYIFILFANDLGLNHSLFLFNSGEMYLLRYEWL